MSKEPQTSQLTLNTGLVLSGFCLAVSKCDYLAVVKVRGDRGGAQPLLQFEPPIVQSK